MFETKSIERLRNQKMKTNHSQTQLLKYMFEVFVIPPSLPPPPRSTSRSQQIEK